MSTHCHSRPELEVLEDRCVPAVIAPTTTTTPPTPGLITTQQAALGIPITQLSPAGAITTTPTATTPLEAIPALGAPLELALFAPGLAASNVATTAGPVSATSTQFGVAALPGGPVNSTLGGTTGVLSTGAMVTNGTTGLPLGGVLQVTPSEQVSSIDVLFGPQGLAVRSLLPVTQSVGGSMEPLTTRSGYGPTSPAEPTVLDGLNPLPTQEPDVPADLP